MLDRRALNRSLLARQGLLERSATPVPDVLERLVGLQAQVPSNPYVALWSRLEAFDPLALSAMVEDGRAVRAGLMRATIHLVTARDHDALQPVMGDVLARTFRGQFAKFLGDEDQAAIVTAGRGLLAETPRTRADLSATLAPSFSTARADAVGHAVVHHLPLVQTPPRGLWGRGGQARWALREPASGAAAPVDEIVLRYLRAFGPATPSDVRTWCGLTGLRAVIDRLDLVALGGLLDVRDAPWPDPDTPAPPRFLPEYDNVFLSHADRSRIVGGPNPPPGGGQWNGILLVDGFTAAGWSYADGTVRLHHEVPRAARDEVDAEAAALAALIDSAG